MRKIICALAAVSIVVSCTAYAAEEVAGKHAVVKRQCHLYDEPSTYRLVAGMEKDRDMKGLKTLTGSARVKWIYLGYVVRIDDVDGDLARITVISPRDAAAEGWVELENLRY